MIKTLCYISKINKIKKEMKVLFLESMKNMKISFIEEENKIKYEEYYFSLIPKPNDIEIKEIETNGFKVFWTINNNYNNINEIKYKIEIKKDNTNDNFIQIDVGKNNNYKFNNLEKNTNYEIRICSIYQDLMSNWTKIYKIKTGFFDSVILNEIKKGEEYLNKLYEWTGYKKMELLYRATRDGSDSNIFHNKCDNQGPTICLCKNDKGSIFGGYISSSWTSEEGPHGASHSFLFALLNIHGTVPTIFPNLDKYHSTYNASSYNSIFCQVGHTHDLYIANNFLINDYSYSDFSLTYKDVLGKGKSIFTGDPNNNNIFLKKY